MKMRLSTLLLLILSAAVCNGVLRAVEPEVPIMKVSEIRRGMTGYGRTVFQGDSIEQFEVKIIGTLKNFMPKKDIILAELQGEKLRHTGVIGGMSGSPIYVGDKLVGALAYGWQFSKDPIFGITPIEQMLKIDSEVSTASPSAEDRSAPAQNEALTPQLYNPFEPPENPLTGADNERGNSPGVHSGNGGSNLVRLQVPLIFSGCSPELIERYSGIFSRFGLVPLQGGSSGSEGIPSGPDASRFEAGAAVCAQLVRGDISLAATGTLTHRNGDSILAFGHPFLQFGPVDFPMTAAEIVTVIPNLASSFKISNSTTFMGSVRADHSNGIYGVIGAQPKMIPISIGIDIPGMRSERFSYETVVNRRLTPVLGTLAMFNSLTAIGDAFSAQAIEVSGRIEINGTEPLVIENMYAGPQAVVQATMAFQSAMQYLYGNYFGPADVTGMDFSFEAREGFPQLRVSEARVGRDILHPGEELELEVVLEPKGESPRTERFSIEMPPVDSDTRLFVLVGEASMITRMEFQLSPSRFLYTSLEHLVRLINGSRRNDALYVKVFRMDQGIMLDGREMPGLPPSVWNMLRTGKSSGNMQPLNDLVVEEIEKPTGHIVGGFKMLQVDLKPEP